MVIGFGKYLIEEMLMSTMILDLRYYKGNSDIVPFRFCNPLRAEAITIIAAILLGKESPLKGDIVNRLIPLLSIEKDKLQAFEDNPEGKMRFVEALWLFGTLLDCQDERLRYEILNNGSY